MSNVPNFLQPQSNQYVNFLYWLGQSSKWNIAFARPEINQIYPDPVWWIKLQLTNDQLTNMPANRACWLEDWPVVFATRSLLFAHIDKQAHCAAVWLPRWDATMTDKHYAGAFGYMSAQPRDPGTYWMRYKGEVFTDQEKQDYLAYKTMAMEENT